MFGIVRLVSLLVLVMSCFVSLFCLVPVCILFCDCVVLISNVVVLF